jgi:Xaa-Pro aminopeptidase
VLLANEILPTNADGVFPFRQNSDLFYLSGIDQEETRLIIITGATADSPVQTKLFIRRTDDHLARWEGEKLTREAAAERSGIPLKDIHWADQFDAEWPRAGLSSETIFLSLNEHLRAAHSYPTIDYRFAQLCRERFPLHRYERLSPRLTALRMSKSAAEIDQVREAISITADGFARVARLVKPGVGEWELEAEFAHEFIRQRSRGFAYEPIIASGPGSCVLHYVKNNQRCAKGQVLLLDVAAEYGNYHADLTRVLPVSGKFSPRQAAVYDSVLRVFHAACALLRPGLTLVHWNEAVGTLMSDELVALKLLTRAEVKKDPLAYKRYYMHGTGHHLGLAVHDVTLPEVPLPENALMTVEPGIYIPEEALGIRLENNLLVRSSGNLDLMDMIPIERRDVESLMPSPSAKK